MYKRSLISNVKQKLGKGKAIILVGPRQVGKTTLIKELLAKKEFLFLDADNPTIRRLLTSPNTEQIKRIIGKHKIVFIDEAQRIFDIGITIKIIIDQLKDVQVLVSGSSSFDLTKLINEPLTGRKWEFELFPISWEEYELFHGYLIAEQQLENRLLYGFYPEILNHNGDEIDYLKELVNSYLYKDILAFSQIRKPAILEKLLEALALQIGNEVSYNELAQIVGVDKNTINNYIDILQKGYVVFKLSSFSKNLRNEIKTNKKIYFYDVGVRNMILGNFNSLATRDDKGALWENFLIAERMKQNRYRNSLSKTFFWRTKQQQEIDFVESNGGKLTAYEFKWNAKGKSKLSKTFMDEYSAKGYIIDRNNFRDFVTKKI